MQHLEVSASFRNFYQRHSRRKVATYVLVSLCLAACNGSPSVTCEIGAAGNQSTIGACGNAGGTSQTGDATSNGGESTAGTGGITGGIAGTGGISGTGGTVASGGNTSTAKGSLIANGSFELDYQDATTTATAPPNGWTMVSSNSGGALLHAVQSDETIGVPSAAQGLNVARFDSLISSSYREAHSECFSIDVTKALTARYQVRIPVSQLPAGTKASVKFWYYLDASCTKASAVRATDTQTATSNTSADVWEQHQFTPAQNPPSDSQAATLSIRGAYVAGSSCGSAGTNCQSDVIYYDDVAVNQ